MSLQCRLTVPVFLTIFGSPFLLAAVCCLGTWTRLALVVQLLLPLYQPILFQVKITVSVSVFFCSLIPRYESLGLFEKLNRVVCDNDKPI